MELRILTAVNLEKCLPMPEAIEGMKRAYAALSGGAAVMPLRGRLEMGAGMTLLMPAYLPDDGALAVKIVSVFPENAALGKTAVSALVLALDSHTGHPLALLNGEALTAIRTGAGAGAATDLLARADSTVVAIIGSGVQARSALTAVCAVRPIQRAIVYSPTIAHAAQFAREMGAQLDLPITVAATADEAVAQADIVCTATTSATPVFDGHALKSGTHVNAVGSYTPQMQEVDGVTIGRARVVVDSKTAVLAETGDLIIPIRDGLILPSHIYAELGEIVRGEKAGRANADEITYFKSVGVAVQDAIAAAIALQNSAAMGLGATVTV